MRILVVEDEEAKRREVGACLRETWPGVDLIFAASFHSGVSALNSQHWDVVILDMTMPSFDVSIDEDGGRPQAYGGREILRHLDRKGIEVPCVVLTQFDTFGSGAERKTLSQLDEELRIAHPRTYQGAVHYDVAVEGWRDALIERTNIAVTGK